MGAYWSSRPIGDHSHQIPIQSSLGRERLLRATCALTQGTCAPVVAVNTLEPVASSCHTGNPSAQILVCTQGIACLFRNQLPLLISQGTRSTTSCKMIKGSIVLRTPRSV